MPWERDTLKTRDICITNCQTHIHGVTEYFCASCDKAGCHEWMIIDHRKCKRVCHIKYKLSEKVENMKEQSKELGSLVINGSETNSPNAIGNWQNTGEAQANVGMEKTGLENRLTDELKKTEALNQDLIMEIIVMEQKESENAAVNRQKEALEEKSTRLREVLVRIQQEKINVDIENAGLKQNLSLSERKCQDIKFELDAHRVQLEEICDNQGKERKELTNQIGDAEHKKEDAMRKVDELLDENARLRDYIVDASKSIIEAEAQAKVVMEKTGLENRLRKDLSILRDELKKTQSLKHGLFKENIVMEHTIRQKESENNAVNRQKEAIEEENTRINADLFRIQQEKINVDKENDELKQTLSVNEWKCQNIQSELDAHRVLLEEICDNQGKKRKELINQIGDAEYKKEAAMCQVDELKDTNARQGHPISDANRRIREADDNFPSG